MESTFPAPPACSLRSIASAGAGRSGAPSPLAPSFREPFAAWSARSVRGRRHVKTLQLTAVLALTASTAWASATYPPAIKMSLKLTRQPDCIVCHSSSSGGAGTAVTPFARSARDHGLEGASDTSKLEAVLEQMETGNTDSDGDGVGDITELRDGSDPNKKDREPPVGSAVDDPPQQDAQGDAEPAQGCSAVGGEFSWLALGLLALIRRRWGART